MDTTYQTSGTKEKASAKLHAVEEQVRESIDANPAMAVLTAFGIGLGLGVAVGAVIAESTFTHKRPRSSMEEFGRSVMAAASKFVPDFK